MGKRIGIDLGTTYCCVSYIDEMGVPRIIDNPDTGSYTTPSIVYFDPNGENVVGVAARQEGALNPECMVEKAKTFMGDPNYCFNINGEKYSPMAVSTIILRQLIKYAEEAIGCEEIDGAVITCPAYFGDGARDTTMNAGKSVTLSDGRQLNIYRILDEPVAAAIAYGKNINEDVNKTIMVYDLGGGTFDCTIMKIDISDENRKMKVITTSGNPQLGGKDWDNSFSEYVIQEFCAKTGCDPDEMRNDPENIQWFSEKIEQTKIMLSNKEKTILTPSFGSTREQIEVTREKFEEITESHLTQTINIINQMFIDYNKNKDEKITMDDIDEIILIGGSTKMPQVRRRLEAEYNRPISTFEPDKAVAIGAAYYANSMETTDIIKDSGADDGEAASGADAGKSEILAQADHTEIVLTCTKSYGVEAYVQNDQNGEFTEAIVGNIIYKDTEKPAVEKREFFTSCENQQAVEIEVYENDSREENVNLEECTKIYKSCTVELLPGLPDRSPLEVTFDLDADGILKVTVYDVKNQKYSSVVPERIGDENNQNGMDRAKTAVLR